MTRILWFVCPGRSPAKRCSRGRSGVSIATRTSRPPTTKSSLDSAGVVSLYYQTTSREYVEFLRDEINGTADTLYSPTFWGDPEAYIVQTDPFFGQLRAGGDTIWQLWTHNMDVPGAAPILMARASVGVDSRVPEEQPPSLIAK